MNLPKNLQYLRKRDKITQEELADRLGVSRQAVSKWETGEAYPETDKLLVLCDMFDVSLDGLLREELTEKRAENSVPRTDEIGFAAHTDKFARRIAAGVFLVLMGVAVCMVFAGWEEFLSGKMAKLVGVLAGVSVIVFVAIAVFLFVFAGMEHDRFKKEHPEVGNIFGEEETKAFGKRLPVIMACLVSGILIDVVFLVVLSSLVDAGIIAAANEDAAYAFIVAVFMAAFAFIVGGLTYYGISSQKYNVAEYNKQTRDELNPTSRKKLADVICGAIMLTATAIYLLIGFVWNMWHPGWIVFPVGGIICAVISVLFNISDR